jgi:hypothetical protein
LVGGGSVPLQADDGRVAGLAVERAVVLGELAGLERLGALLALEAEPPRQCFTKSRLIHLRAAIE